MRAIRNFALLLALLAPAAFADGLYSVEMIIFRQAGDPIPSSQPAPDDWAAGSQSIAGSERATALDGEAAKLNPNAGYEVLLHKAWSQNLSAIPNKVAVSIGEPQLGHFPVEGTLALTLDRSVDAEADFWINQFDGSGLISSSERLRQGTRLKNGELTYLDHGNLGILIRISPL
ncbi:CsiV family protein [Pseudomonas sp. Q1-7]|uniref:CsiV family protein n=1 Tax=Pseudomonas sp. Q1-7 TaxID=3020843 RepID=UPI002300EEFB|nr:CsiV family protein [Pseudomonas sp. Q1-7]